MIRGTGVSTRIIQKRYWLEITIHGANTHEENIEAVSTKDQKPFSDEQARFAQKTQAKHQMKDKIAQKGTVCPRAMQREHKNFKENSTPERLRSQEHIPLKYENPLLTLPFGSKKISFTGNDVSADAGFPRVVTPPSAGMA
jgi:hypothetical protein